MCLSVSIHFVQLKNGLTNLHETGVITKKKICPTPKFLNSTLRTGNWLEIGQLPNKMVLISTNWKKAIYTAKEGFRARETRIQHPNFEIQNLWT